MKAISLALLILIAAPGLRTNARAAGVDDPKQAVPAGSTVHTSEDSEIPNAVLLSLTGTCEVAEDGVHFRALTSKDVFTLGLPVPSPGFIQKEEKFRYVFTQGAVVRTGPDSRMDIFFRRIGTTVRLQSDTEIRLEKMSRGTQDGQPVLDTLLDLRRGRIFTVVRSLVAGSTFEIRNKAGRSVVEGATPGTVGRYIITADGTHVTDKSSHLPLKFVEDKGISVIRPGEKYEAREGKMLAIATPDAVQTLIEFDELHALVEKSSPPQ